MLMDYHTHVMAHGERAWAPDTVEPFLQSAVRAGLSYLGLADHDWYEAERDPGLLLPLREKYPQLQVSFGVEIDHDPARLPEIRRIVAARDYDYVIGSVHNIGDWPFDHPDYRHMYEGRDIDEAYRAYFALVQDAAETGLYQLMGHLDLIKVFGYRPKGKVGALCGGLMQVLAKADVAAEINTNGRYKPVAEFYPSRELLEELYRYDIPITLSSDAHQAEDVGRDLAEARQMAYQVGYRKLATFCRRQRILVDI